MAEGGAPAATPSRVGHHKDFSFCSMDSKGASRRDAAPEAPVWEGVEYGSLRGLENERALARAGHTATPVDTSLIVMFGFRKEPRSQGKTYLSDVLRFDTRSCDWSKIGELGSGRGHHTATLVGRRIWVIGGQDSQYIFDGVLCFDVDKLKWIDLGKERKGGFQITWPRTRDGHSLARRTCHAATLHPYNEKAIVVCGGISQAETGGFMCRNDVFMLNTISGQVQILMKLDYGGISFHSAVMVKSSILIVGGNQGSRHAHLSPTNDSGSGPKPVLEVLIPFGEEWRNSDVKLRKGRSLLKISSQASVEYKGMVLCHGGLRGKKKLSNDLLCLSVGPDGSWECTEVPTASTTYMEGRLTHTLSIVNNNLYIFGGCIASHIYSGKMWRLDLSTISRKVASSPFTTGLVPPETPKITMASPLMHAYSTPVHSDEHDLDAARVALEESEAWQLKERKRSEKLRNREMLHDELARRVSAAMAFGNSLNEATNSGTGYDATADGTQTRKLASVPVDRIPWSTDPPSPAAPVEPQPDNRVWSQKTPEQDIKTLKEDIKSLFLDNQQPVLEPGKSNRTCSCGSEHHRQLQKELDDLRLKYQQQQVTIKHQEAIIVQQRDSIKDLEEGAERANEDLRERGKTARNLQARISDLEAEVSGLTEDAAASAQRLEAAHKEMTDALEARINQRDEELEKLAEQLESAKQEMQRYKDEIGKATEDHEVLNEQLKGHMDEADNVKQAKETLEETLAELRRNYGRAEKDHAKTVREWEVLCSSLRSDLDIELSQLREAKDTEILRLKQQLMQKESAMKRMQAEWETKMEAKSQALSDAHKAATQERESLFQDRQAARIQLAEERTARSAEIAALKHDLDKALADLKMSRMRIEELQSQRIARSVAVGEAVRSRRKDIQELADRFGRDLAGIDEKYAKAIGFLGSGP